MASKGTVVIERAIVPPALEMFLDGGNFLTVALGEHAGGHLRGQTSKAARGNGM